MKKLLSGILASSMLLSSLPMTVTAQETTTGTKGTAVYTATLSASESDFTFVSGVITEYTGSGGNVVIPSTIGGQAVTSIGTKAFLNNTTVESVTMPSSLERIEATAFEGCSNLRSVELNEGLQFLGFNSFGRTTNLSKIWIPSTVTEMEQGVFYESGLTSAYIPQTVRQVGPYIFDKCTRLHSVIFMANVDTLPTGTFRDCSVMEDVYLKEGIKNIGASAFSGCGTLMSITLPSTTESIGQYSFAHCSKLEKLDFTNTNLKSVDLCAFQHCTSVTEAIFPYGFTTFSYGNDYTYNNKGQFYGCSSLTDLRLPSTLHKCYEYSLLGIVNCHPLNDSGRAVTIYGYVGTMADTYTNYYGYPWYSLGDVENENQSPTIVPTTAPTLPTKAEMAVTLATPTPTPNASAESDFVLGDGGIITSYTGQGGDVAIPSTIGGKTIYGIGPDAFRGNTQIHSVTMPNTLERIESFAFDGCVNLSSVTLNEGLQYLGLNSFAGTSSLSSVWLPSSLTQLAQGVFYQSGLTSAYVPATVKSMGGCVFQACENLTDAIIMADIARLPSYTFHYCTKLENVYLREGITNIGWNAFNSCRGLKGITLPTTTSIIEEGAFSGCSNIEKLDFTNTKLTTVGYSAFQYCTSLTEAIFPYGFRTFVTGEDSSLTQKAQFKGCTSLTKVVLPSTIIKIEFYQQFILGLGSLITGYFLTVYNQPFTESNSALVIYGYDGTKADALANASYATELGWFSLGSTSNENQNPILTPIAVPTLPTAPTTASTPTVTPTTPQVDSNTKTATPSTAKVMVNGVEVNFGAYNIDGYNYFKLTDMSYALNGTAKQFLVSWDAEKNAINMVSGDPHNELGTELLGNSGQNEVADEFLSPVLQDGSEISVVAYIIDGSSYFQLDTLKEIVGIDVGWDGATGTITITT